VVILRIHLPQRVVAWTRFIVVNLVSEFLGRFFANVSGKFIDIRVNFLFDYLMTVWVVCRKFIGVGVVLQPANVMTQVVPFGLLVASGSRQAVVALFSSLADPARLHFGRHEDKPPVELDHRDAELGIMLTHACIAYALGPDML
jgi:hypothetical protein